MISLSPSSIGQFDSCPACFWWEKKRGVPRPRGIFPGILGAMDKAIKVWFDQHRSKGQLPPEIVGKVKGLLFPDQTKVNFWRNWNCGLFANFEGANLSGLIDDAVLDENKITVFDYKTRGAPPKSGESERYYGSQLDAYGLLFQKNGHEITGKGHLAYYWPTQNSIGPDVEPNVNCLFKSAVVNLEVKPERTLELIRRIVETVSKDSPPDSASDCEHCEYVKARN